MLHKPDISRVSDKDRFWGRLQSNIQDKIGEYELVG
jgi:hypothetical protein